MTENIVAVYMNVNKAVVEKSQTCLLVLTSLQFGHVDVFSHALGRFHFLTVWQSHHCLPNEWQIKGHKTVMLSHKWYLAHKCLRRWFWAGGGTDRSKSVLEWRVRNSSVWHEQHRCRETSSELQLGALLSHYWSWSSVYWASVGCMLYLLE